MFAKLFPVLCAAFLLIVTPFDLVHAQDQNKQSSAPTSASSAAETSPTPIPTPIPPAVQPVDLTVSPISMNLVTDPNTPTSSTMKIRNNSDKPEFLRLRLNTFSANETGDSPVIREFDPEDEMANWLKFSETEFRIGPGEWKTVQLTFSPPATAALGYYYAILVERQAEASAEEGTSLIAGVPAILVLSEVHSPLAKRQLELVSFKAKNVQEYLPAEFEVIIKNTGNIQTLPIGNIFIDGQGINDIGMMQLNPAKGVILPGTERTFKMYWDDGFPRYVTEKDSLGKETKKLQWDFSNADKFRIGKFTATAFFIYDDGEKDIPTEATLSFWILPWKLIAVAVVAGILLLSGIILPIVIFTKQLRKKRLSKNDTTL